MAKRNNSTPVMYAGLGHDVAILAGAGVTVALEYDRPASSRAKPSSGLTRPGLMDGAEQSVAVPDESQYPSVGGDLMPWGDDNDFPQRIVDLYNKDPLIPPSLGKVASMIQGNGVMPVIEDVDEKGNEIVRPIDRNLPVSKEIYKFLTSRHFARYMREMPVDCAWFYNGWPEFIKSKDHSRINRIHPLNAEECRWIRMTERGELPYIYLSANWARQTTSNPLVKRIKALDPYHPDAVAWLREQKEHNVVYPISYPTPGKRFYSLPHHYSIVESGWLDVHLAIPEFKKYLMKNQMTIKYHWKVDKEYWAATYGDAYTKGKPAQKLQIKKTWLTQMNKSLTDVTKAGNSIITELTYDKVNKQFIDHIQVTAMSDLIKDGKYNEDNVEAGSYILYALNLDPAISGFMGGKNQSATSGGSNKREAYLLAIQMLKPFRDMLLEPVHFVAEYNGWKDAIPGLSFRFRDTILTTLDTGAGTAKKLS